MLKWLGVTLFHKMAQLIDDHISTGDKVLNIKEAKSYYQNLDKSN